MSLGRRRARRAIGVGLLVPGLVLASTPDAGAAEVPAKPPEKQPSAKANPMLNGWYYAPDELAKYAYFADFAYLGKVMNEWNTRWEKEIVPLVRRG